MKSLLLLITFLSQPACILAPTSPTASPQDPQPAQAVEAVFARGAAADFHDADPVQARAASFSRPIPVHDAFPWLDRLVELEPGFVRGPVTPAVATPTLSVDLVDSDPLTLRGWN
jgi:hypothetical protein